MTTEVLDIHGHENRYEKWKREYAGIGIPGISKANANLIYRYVIDMETGQNVARESKKGGRGYMRLNTLRARMVFIARALEAKGVLDITKTSQQQIHALFDAMEKGRLKKQDGTIYESVVDYIKVFKAFWHWLQRITRKAGKQLDDITVDLAASNKENAFVHFTKEELEKMLPYFTPDEQVRLLFMFDTIIRSPTELMNVKVSDLTPDCKELHIRNETSKTYGRRIKILLCSEELRKHIERNDLKPADFLFQFSYPLFNRKLKTVAHQVFGGRGSKGGSNYSELSCYDFRHSGACHWRLGAYRSKIDALMYRGGWSDLKMLNYYTKQLGMKDSIEKDDLLVGIDKTELEQQLAEQKSEMATLRRMVVALKNQQQDFQPLSIAFGRGTRTRSRTAGPRPVPFLSSSF